MNRQHDKIKTCKKLCNITEESHTVGICDDISLCRSGRCKTEYTDFIELVEKAFFPRGNGKKDPHQYRIRKRAYKKFQHEVKKLERKIIEQEDFDGILAVVSFKGNDFPKPIKGIGELTEYDIAFRIGKCLGKCPDKLYLHAGTREGAVNANFNVKNKQSLSREEICLELDFLQNVPMCQIENFLCVCKKAPTQESFECYKKFILEKR